MRRFVLIYERPEQKIVFIEAESPGEALEHGLRDAPGGSKAWQTLSVVDREEAATLIHHKIKK